MRYYLSSGRVIAILAAAALPGLLFHPAFPLTETHANTLLYQQARPCCPVPKPPKTKAREWAGALTFAIVAATPLRWSAVEAYTISSKSMKGTLLVGDTCL